MPTFAEKRDAFKTRLHERLIRDGGIERRKDTIGAIPMRSIEPLVRLCTEVARQTFAPDPGTEPERSDDEVRELIVVGNKMATKLSQMTRGRRAAGTEYTEVRRLLRTWDALLDEDDDDEDMDEVPVPNVAHPHLRTKDWEQIWTVLTGGRIHDYDGFRDVGVEQTMTVEEFMDRLRSCTIQIRGGLPPVPEKR